jgi:LuxR family maltose regulon positive regulatory protein
VSIDQHDNDPIRLCRTLIETVARLQPAVPVKALSRAAKGIEAGMTLIVPALSEALTALPSDSIIIVDELDHLRDPRCFELIQAFIEALPPNVVIAIASRFDPPFPLARWRANGMVTEFRASHLRFSPAEAHAVACSVAQTDISAEAIDYLMDQTEGWPAGIYLAALSLRDQENPLEFVHSFSGKNRHLADYLTEEVFRRLPDETRAWVIQISVLDRFSASLCDAVRDATGSAEIIAELDRSNVLVVPLDDQREWYRLHHLLRDLLQSELRKRDPDSIPVLHTRAGLWFSEHGQMDEAIAHALESADVTLLAQLIGRYSSSYVWASADRVAIVRDWIDRVGSRVDDHPMLGLVAARIDALSGRLAEARRRLRLLETATFDGPLPDGSSSLEAAVELLRSMFLFDGVDNAIASARRALALEPPGSPFANLAQASLAMALTCADRIDEAKEAFAQARLDELPDVARMTYTAVSANADLCDEEPFEAFPKATEAVRMVERFELAETPQASIAYMALGWALLEQGNLYEAEAYIERAARLRPRTTSLTATGTALGLIVEARLRLRQRDSSAAAVLLNEAAAAIREIPDAALFQRLLAEHWQEVNRKPHLVVPGMFEHLSDRERDVLRLLQHPLSRTTIGERLGISKNTVNSHIRTIFQKLGVSSREEAIDAARKLGLISQRNARSA